MGLHNIWSLGRVGRLGRPLIETVVTIGSYEHSGNYIVRDGSTIGELLQFANIRLKDGDTVVRGGRCAARASTGSTAASPKGPTAFS